ncbi:hypothetical protein FACS1894151_01110 [Spirochaetia bacterium]|nr:hypothetical protein FACS1894151_01110 [Spirochaetia bacterium]
MFDNLTLFGKIFSIIFLPILYLIMIILCFWGGTFVDPAIGLAYSGFPLIIGSAISIFYIIVSIENKKFHPFVFCVIILFLSIIFGNNYIKNKAGRLVEIGTKIENYFKENNLEIMNNSDLNQLNINENINVKVFDNIYFEIEFENDRRFHYNSKCKKIFYKNIP